MDPNQSHTNVNENQGKTETQIEGTLPHVIPFTKMHGIGNDYVYVNCLTRQLENEAALARFVSNRNFGVGSDGLVLIEPSSTSDYKMRMLNADGSEAEMCGNAVRCVGKFLFDKGITEKTELTLETLGGVQSLQLLVEDDVVHSVRVGMGAPVLQGLQIPITEDLEQCVRYPFSIDGFEAPMTCVSMGNPHAVFFVNEITDQQVLEFGPKVEVHHLFPNKTNVEFVKVESPQELTMRVWERGTGETLACGTGAAAVHVAAVLNELTERKTIIHLQGGDLEMEWGDDGQVYMTGPATTVFDGSLFVSPDDLR